MYVYKMWCFYFEDRNAFFCFCIYVCFLVKTRVDWPGKEQEEVEGELGEEMRTFDSMVEEEESSIMRNKWLRVKRLRAVSRQLKTN